MAMREVIRPDAGVIVDLAQNGGADADIDAILADGTVASPCRQAQRGVLAEQVYRLENKRRSTAGAGGEGMSS